VSEVSTGRAVRPSVGIGNVRLIEFGKRYFTAEQKKAMRRVGDLTRIYRLQYPGHLPDNELGVKCARYMCRTLAFFASLDERKRWLDRYAPWMTGETRSRILSLPPHWYSAKSLGDHVELYDEDREKLKTWTIEACDVTKERRKLINKKKNCAAQERYRRKRGGETRAQYLAKNVKSRKEPWVSLNMSRAKYYRLVLHKTETDPSAVRQVRNDPLLLSQNTPSRTCLKNRANPMKHW
jgi:hypothetical protein